MNPGKQTAVLGATGAVGQALVSQLLAARQRVRVFARQSPPDAPAGLDWRQTDFEQLEQELVLEGVEVLYCCLGTTLKQAGSREAFRRVDHDYVLTAGRAAKAANVPCMVLVSAVGADPGSAAFYSRVKGETEADLTALGLPCLHILRPSLLLGPRPDSRPAESLGKALAPMLSPLLVGPLRKYRPIPAVRVAAAMITVAARPDRGHFVHFLPLPED